MPTYLVTDPDSGRKVRLTGDSPPTDDEIESIFAGLPELSAAPPKTQQPQEQEKDPSIMDKIGGAAEVAGSVLSSVVAEPAAGLAGLATGALTQDPAAAAAVVGGVRDRLTMKPETEKGREYLGDVADVIEPVADAMGATEEFLGRETLELTGSPELAAIAHSVPTAILELAGFKMAGGLRKVKTAKEINKIIKESAPSSETLKNAARASFKQLDESGVTVKPEQFAQLAKDSEKAAMAVGARRRTTPQIFGVLDEFKDIIEDADSVKLDELVQVREVASNVAKNIDPSIKAPALAIIDEIDGFLDGINSADLLGSNAGNVGQQYRQARRLWGQSKKSEVIANLVEEGKRAASGWENGIRIEARKLLKNKKRANFFNKEEVSALKRISEGTTGSNFAKMLGRLGITEGQAINIVNPALAGGVVATMFGSTAGVAVPVIGQVSKQLAQRLTMNNAKFADRVVRAGRNAETIAKAYVRNTKRGARSAEELSELLLRNEVDLSTVKSAIAKEAADIAKARRAALGGAALGGSARVEDDNN